MNIDPELLLHWKELHGKIYSVTERGVQYVFRAATFEEFEKLELSGTELSSAEQEDFLVGRCLLSPQDVSFDNLSAGFVSVLAAEILEISGFGGAKSAKNILEAARERAQQFRFLMKAFIIAAMPSYNDEVLDKYNFEQLSEKVAIAEQILSIQLDREAKLQIIDPEEEAVKQEEELRKERAVRKPGQAMSNDPIAQKLRSSLG